MATIHHTASVHLTQGTVSVTKRCPFRLESGKKLESASLRYAIYGEPNEECSNVTLVCHALSGSARVDQWWPELLEQVFDLERECVVCFNLIGSCYGSTSAASLNPATGKPYGGSFPQVTVRDWVRAEKIALEELGIRHLRTVIGPSIGGMQALQWAVEYPEWADRVIAMGTTPLGALGLALNHLQREMIRLDPEWRGGDYYDGPGPRAGLAQARGWRCVPTSLLNSSTRGTGAKATARESLPGSRKRAGSISRATLTIKEKSSGSALTPTHTWRSRERWICLIRSGIGMEERGSEFAPRCSYSESPAMCYFRRVTFAICGRASRGGSGLCL